LESRSRHGERVARQAAREAAGRGISWIRDMRGRFPEPSGRGGEGVSAIPVDWSSRSGSER